MHICAHIRIYIYIYIYIWSARACPPIFLGGSNGKSQNTKICDPGDPGPSPFSDMTNPKKTKTIENHNKQENIKKPKPEKTENTTQNKHLGQQNRNIRRAGRTNNTDDSERLRLCWMRSMKVDRGAEREIHRRKPINLIGLESRALPGCRLNKVKTGTWLVRPTSNRRVVCAGRCFARVLKKIPDQKQVRTMIGCQKSVAKQYLKILEKVMNAQKAKQLCQQHE